MPIKTKAIKPMNTSETQTIYTLDFINLWTSRTLQIRFYTV